MSDETHIEMDERDRTTAEAVDRAVERLRAEPGAGFEDRVFMATRPATPTVVEVKPRVRVFTPMRLAAAIAIAAGAAALMLSRPAPVAPSRGYELASLEAEVDEWLDLTTTFDNGLTSEIDSLAIETSILSSEDLGEFYEESL